MNNSNYYDAVRQRPDLIGGQAAALGMSDPKLSNRSIPQAIDQMEKELHLLGEHINELRNRLNPLMRPEPPETNNKQDVPLSSVPLVQAFDRHNRAINAFADQIRDLVQRLEI